MKKSLAIFLAGTMACSMFALSACGGSGDVPLDGTVEGAYQELSEENTATLSAYVQEIDTQTILGDMTQETWGAGISFALELTTKSGAETQEVALDMQAAVKASAAETALMGYDAKAAVNMTMEMKGFTEAEMNGKQEMNVYLDNLWLYMDSATNGTVTTAGKVQTMTLIEMAMGMLEGMMGAPAEPASETGTGTETGSGEDTLPEEISFEDLLAALETYGVKVAFEIDETTGIKFKFSATDDTFNALFAMADGGGATTATFEDDSKFDMYLVIGADGILDKFTLDVDITAAFDGQAAVTFQGAMVLELTEWKEIVIPETVANYIDMTDYITGGGDVE